jgi:hypothetical protein
VGSFEVVFDEPFGELPVEDHGVGTEVPHLQELVPEGLVEALADGIVLRRFRTRVVLGYAHLRARRSEVLLELGTVVVPYVQDLVVEEKREPHHEVRSVVRGFGGVHAGEGDLRCRIDTRENIPLEAAPVEHDGVEADEESGHVSLLELGDALLFERTAAPGLDAGVPHRPVIQVPFHDDLLHMPRRDRFAVLYPVEPGDLLAAVADMALTKGDDPHFLFLCDGPVPPPVRNGGFGFEGAQAVWRIALLPGIERLAGNPEMAAGEGDVFGPVIMVEPREALLGVGGDVRGEAGPAFERRPAFQGEAGVGISHGWDWLVSWASDLLQPILLARRVLPRYLILCRAHPLQGSGFPVLRKMETRRRCLSRVT